MNTQRISVILTILSLFLFTNLAAPDVRSPTHSFTILNVPGATYTNARSINDNGQVAGYYRDGSHYHSFVYSNGTFTTFDVPGATDTEACSINNNGQVAGYYRDGSHYHSFVYSNGTFTTLDAPGATSTYASSINASGQVVGTYWDGSHSHGFVYSNRTFTAFDDPYTISIHPSSINASGQVVGSYWDGSHDHGFVYSNGTFTSLDVPGATKTYARSINASGQVTGGYSDGTFQNSHGFLYSKGTFTILDVPGATYGTYPASLNASGQVTGTYCKAALSEIETTDCPGFVYSDGTFTTLDIPHAMRISPTIINASGQVVGSYYDGGYGPGRPYSFIATPVCAAPTVTIHTLTTAPQGGFRITGSITDDGAPLCALVLANGQFLFTCGDPLPKGDFDLTVPVDDQGQITLFGFSSGLAPFQQTLGPGALPASVNATSCATPKVTYTTAAAPEGRFRLTGSITLGGDPLCALVLANGQFLFTCGDPLPKGDFDLTVPLNGYGQITLFGFSAGLLPFQQTFSPAPSTSP
ncbi:MAG: hypothetical protein F9K25_18530 [Candidatus Contendobacter sp.]|nr:MAG: hypothetical protein F9K25_18530 [Candidatus Contendobacter sp.]